MSLAYKLWRIGSVLTKDHIRKSIEDLSDLNDPNYARIEFTIENNAVKDVHIDYKSVEKSVFFFSRKMGGSGTGIFYLYPNLNLQKSILAEKFNLLSNTLSKSCGVYASESNKVFCKIISDYLADFDKYLDKADLELNKDSLKKAEVSKKEKNIKDVVNWDSVLLDVAKELVTRDKGNYKFWFSINGKTFYEQMPEVWDNWFRNPTAENETVREGYDFFTGKETRVGYRPDIKIFSYDNYHDSLNNRVTDNLPLSAESAKNIRFAWMYILDNLVFYYKGLEYIMIPNVFRNDEESLKKVVSRLTKAHGKSTERRATIKKVSGEEKKLLKDIEKLEKQRKEENKKKLEELLIKQADYQKKLEKTDIGWIKEVETNIDEIGDLKNAITLDFLFTEINRTNLSFFIKGSIEDVVPSRINKVVEMMKNQGIDDNVKMKRRKDGNTPLQNFFNRDQLYFMVTRSTQNNKNSILNEQLYLAKLLLTDQTIKLDDLLRRFEVNREYSWERKKRITKDKIKEWIEFPVGFIKEERKVLNFLTSFHKIQE